MDAPFRIRAGTAADAVPVATLERLCFDDPWSDESIRDSLTGGWSFGLTCVPRPVETLDAYKLRIAAQSQSGGTA